MDFEPYFKVHNLVSVHPKIIILAGCKESCVRQPGASGFCDRASEFSAKLAQQETEDYFFGELKLQKYCKKNVSHS